MTAVATEFFPEDELGNLAARLEAGHAERRLAMERRHHHQALTWHSRFFHLENWYSIHGLIRHCLRLTGLHRRGQENARKIRLREQTFLLDRLPEAFRGFRILHLTDLHLDMDLPTTEAIAAAIRGLDYDICVLTGDYRANTFGDSDRAMALLAELLREVNGPVYGILGNHDSIRMVPKMEQMGVRVLINEGLRLVRGEQSIGLAGIDDGHYFRLHDIERAARAVAQEEVRILLSHTPEVFREAAKAGFQAFLCGHTHGGQICLPGGIPLVLEARCPRFVGRGHWRHGGMQGYTSAGASTSVVNVRLNCPPEVTVHTLDKVDDSGRTGGIAPAA